MFIYITKVEVTTYIWIYQCSVSKSSQLRSDYRHQWVTFFNHFNFETKSIFFLVFSFFFCDCVYSVLSRASCVRECYCSFSFFFFLERSNVLWPPLISLFLLYKNGTHAHVSDCITSIFLCFRLLLFLTDETSKSYCWARLCRRCRLIIKRM